MEQILFEMKEDFRKWLHDNCLTSKGVWLIFGKPGGPQTVNANEALEEALCFGWIDSQMKSIDDKTYLKYFSPRRKNGEWSEKNKTLVEILEKDGRMTEYGRAKIEEAKQNGTFQPKQRPQITDELIQVLIHQLEGVEPAYTNFLKMSPSVKKIYTGLYHEPKSEVARTARLEKIIGRLNENLKPM